MNSLVRIKKVRTTTSAIICAYHPSLVYTRLFDPSPSSSHPSSSYSFVFVLFQEYREIREANDNSGVSAEIVNDSYTHWKGTLKGPDGTPYAGGVFVVNIVIPPNYPFEPPQMRFDTKVWHPNISSQNGAICLDILKKEWSLQIKEDISIPPNHDILV